LIADCFGGDRRLVPLSRVMFLSFILNASAIVQTNRLMKKMDVRMVAASNALGLVAATIVGISLAVGGYGVWAIVWQSITLNAVKSLVLWFTSGWLPVLAFSWSALRGFFSVGSGMMVSSFLNVLFQNIYSFFIGNRAGLVPLGYYTQADKWSKMGSASLSQVLTASFVPLLSKFQDNGDDFKRYVRKINRFTAFAVFPALLGLAAIGSPLFHTLFGQKWDDAILLFQLLCVRGVFVVLISLYGNYMLSKGYGKRLFIIEVVKDSTIALAIIATIWTWSVELLVVGQLVASIVTWLVVMVMAGRSIGYGERAMIGDLLPFAAASIAMAGITLAIGIMEMPPLVALISSMAGGGLAYLLLMYVFRIPELREASAYLLGRFRKKTHK